MQIMKCAISNIFILTLLFTSSQAFSSVVTIDFDTDVNGNAISPGSIDPANGIDPNIAYPGLGITFINATILGDNEPNRGTPSPPNFLAPVAQKESISLLFDSNTSFVQVLNVTFSSFTITAYDIFDQVLGFVSLPNERFDSLGDIARIDSPGIRKAIFTTSTQYAFDNLSFETIVVPIPPALLLFFTALFSVFGFFRNKKTAPQS